MKIKILFMLLLLICISAIGSDEKIPRPPVDWKPVLGFSSPTSKAFIDTNSLERIQTDTAEYVSGDLLISLNEPKRMKTSNGKTVLVRSLVKTVLVDCTSGLIAPLSDLYFEVAMPTRQHKPLGGFEYPVNDNQVQSLEKSSLTYKTFCPVYL